MNLDAILDATVKLTSFTDSMIVGSPKTVSDLLQALGDESRLSYDTDIAAVPGSPCVGSLFGVRVEVNRYVPDGEFYILDTGGGLRPLVTPAHPAATAATATQPATPKLEGPYAEIAYIDRETLDAVAEDGTILFRLTPEGAAKLHELGISYR